MSGGPTGTITLVFADIEGSTRLLDRLRDAYPLLLIAYHDLVEATIREHDGARMEIAGDGVFATFPTARAAVGAVVDAQRRIRDHHWPEGAHVAVRMGIHSGAPERSEQSWVGMDVHRAARICSAAHGGQVLLSAAARELVGGELPADVSLRDLGEHRLKDLARLERLYQLVVADLPAEFPPIRSLDTLPNNLPRQLSTFVGRNVELAEITDNLRDASLLSLTGPGGVGKTRLTLEVAAQAVEEHRDGVWLVELESVTDDALVLQSIASTLRIKEQPGTPLLETVRAWLDGRQLLLILDNCEHVLEATASVAGALLRGARELKIVVTSREPLGIPGERLYPIPPMSLPDDGHGARPTEVGKSESVRLFVERARAVQPAFELTPRNAGWVAQICRRLDGIPLAIELAAARIRILPPEQIAARLDDRFRLLTGGSRTALPRHRTLRAALDWSYDLLSEAEKTTLARLSVFAGGFTVDAAEAVCGAGTLDGVDILDVLGRLVDKSLVVPDETAGEARHRLLETVRQYAQDKLIESLDAESTHRRHRDWFAQLTDRARPAFFQGPEPRAWLQVLSREHDNLRAALRWTHEDPDGTDVELRMVSGLWRFWEIRGHVAEGRSWLEGALERLGGEPSELRATALTGAGVLAAMAGDHGAAASYLEQALMLQRHLGNPNSIAYASNNLANVAIEREDYGRARELYEQSVSMAESAGDTRAAAFGLINLADVEGRTGRYEAAQELFERSIATFRELGDEWGVAYAYGRSAQTSRREGSLERALALYRDGLEIYRRMGDLRGVARTLQSIGEIELEGGDPTAAARSFGACLGARRDLGDRAGVAIALDRLARVAARTDPSRAARLLGAADALRESAGAALSAEEAVAQRQIINQLRLGLGDTELRGAWEQGETLSLDSAVAYATSGLGVEAAGG